MDVTTGLSTLIHRLSSDLCIDAGALAVTLTALASDMDAAVASWLGLQLTIVERGHPVTLTAIVADHTVRTSLRIPLAGIHPRFDAESRIILYAASPGAFVDLAADLGFAWHLATVTSRFAGEWDGDQRIVLDGDVPRTTLVSGLWGLYELSTINRAIGVLIGQGHHPDKAGDTLRRDAACRGWETSRYAARLLRRSSSRQRRSSPTSRLAAARP